MAPWSKPFDVVAVVPEVVVVRPLELARRCLSQKQAVHVEPGTAGNGGQAVQPVDHCEFAIAAVDAHEPRPHERRIRPEAASIVLPDTPSRADSTVPLTLKGLLLLYETCSKRCRSSIR